MPITNLRKEYTRSDLRRRDLDSNPFIQFDRWFQEALQMQHGEPYAMTLATSDKNGRPSARTMLLRSFDERGFVFYTNYESQKGCELLENPHAALVFHWTELERQVCIAGSVTKTSHEESEAYFKSRPIGSQLAAWASKQSQAIQSREKLDEALKRITDQYQNRDIALPPYWGGFVVSPIRIEFWQGRPNRLHDRFRYTKKSDNSWLIERLSP